MSTYSFKIYKGDHVGDLHVHIFYNKGRRRELLGKYSMINLEPLPGSKHKLNNKELVLLRRWLSHEVQSKKLQDCLKSTVFNSNKLLSEIMNEGKINVKEGRTFITINIPVDGRSN